jgi:hypothetical protein
MINNNGLWTLAKHMDIYFIFLGLNMYKAPALRGRLSFSRCYSKNFQIFPALSVNFKKGP